jgi:hypothetical protein
MASDNGREIAEKRRRERLAASLRENLKRRKAQQRGRENRSADNLENGPQDGESVQPLSEN